MLNLDIIKPVFLTRLTLFNVKLKNRKCVQQNIMAIMYGTIWSVCNFVQSKSLTKWFGKEQKLYTRFVV